MIIEIQGANFVNKGAELMLHAVLEKMRTVFPEAQYAMVPPFGKSTSFEKRANLGLLQKASLQLYGVQWGNLVNIVPGKIRSMYGVVLDKEIDAVLDVSGFAYSDQWGSGPSLRLAKACKKWKKKGTKVVLLPQAFGPFTSKKTKEAMRIVADNADLIFVRERFSHAHLIGVVGERPNIKIAPDITNLIKGITPSDFDVNNNRFCIVPNYRMIDKTCSEKSKAYLPFLIKLSKILQSRKLKPFILIHEDVSDLMLAEKIRMETGGSIPIVKETNPLKIKGILGICEGTVGSRFHGLVSALSQGVPSLATGWSHKYRMLFEDYGFTEGLIEVTDDEEVLNKKLNMIVFPKSRDNISKRLLDRSQDLKELSKGMWQEIFQVI